jgi:peptidoglycan/LPS O-acetylase OafA/YrhL
MNAKQAYLPTLDGWRALAVLAVILYHDSLYVVGPFSTRWFQNYGLNGVDVFFGISGLLICSRLLEEEQMRGSIGLKEFYIRRTFRILPPAYLYLLVLVVLRLLAIIPLMPKELFAAVFFYRNYSRFSVTPGHIDWYTSHFWSLAVEEHFYLLLPSVFYFAPKRWRIPILTATTSVICAWRLYRQQTRPWEFLMQHTDTRLDALLIPAIFAILLARPKVRERLKSLAPYWPLPAVVLFCLLTWTHLDRLTPPAQSILIPLVLLGTVLRPSGWFAAILELSPIRWVGKISYSLYLWQNLFFDGHFLPWFKPLGFLQTFPMRWFALFACATTSYYLLERPMMKLGHRLASSSTPGETESGVQAQNSSPILKI